jgi:hypothetical protein
MCSSDRQGSTWSKHRKSPLDHRSPAVSISSREGRPPPEVPIRSTTLGQAIDGRNIP